MYIITRRGVVRVVCGVWLVTPVVGEIVAEGAVVQAAHATCFAALRTVLVFAAVVVEVQGAHAQVLAALRTVVVEI